MQNYQNDVTATNDCNENEIAINTSGTKGTIPQELRTGFNLGAFCLPLLWGIFNGSYKSALIPFLSYILTYMMTFIPVVGLIGIFVNLYQNWFCHVWQCLGMARKEVEQR